MSRVLALVEGATEYAIIDRVIAPFLSPQGIYLYARITGKPGHQGGVGKFAPVLNDIKNLLKQEPGSMVTTFFDYYGLPLDWPGKRDSQKRSLKDIPGIMETSIAEAVVREFSNSFNPARFIPYIQMYECEALLFSGPQEMANVFERPKLQSIFEKIVKECGGCEQINDDPDNAPSKRIEKHYPSYKKGKSDLAHAYRIVNHIGLSRIREACPHFNEWITRLEQLSSKQSSGLIP